MPKRTNFFLFVSFSLQLKLTKQSLQRQASPSQTWKMSTEAQSTLYHLTNLHPMEGTPQILLIPAQQVATA